MSMTEIIDDMSKYMNKPEQNDGKAYIQHDFKNGKEWVCCPHCGKRQFPLSDGAIIQNQIFLCKGSNCKKEFVVNVGGL